ncbi:MULTISPECIES: hypothetical protein [Shewanella]|uniref:Uncharacterized protein n=1 Tax=Shewanella marisflavi TaxID=260364 RepID=A0ABX5WPR1_9GAMM|nr:MULTISPECIES: hypothetical protein [Shewanella]QDF76234.1 hypothetical protein FGA12_14360 [Shewanella marisflavi]
MNNANVQDLSKPQAESKRTPPQLVSSDERKRRAAKKKESIDARNERVIEEQLRQIVYVLKTFDDVIVDTCSRLDVSREELLAKAFQANKHLLEPGGNSEEISIIYSLKDRVLAKEIPLPDINSLAFSSPDLPSMQLILLDLLFAFWRVIAQAEDLGQSQGSVINDGARKKHQRIQNSINKEGTKTKTTLKREEEAREFIEKRLGAEGIRYVKQMSIAHLAKRLDEERGDLRIPIRTYEKAIKVALAEKGIEKGRKAKKKTISTN